MASLGVAPESFDYRRKEFEHDGLPYIVEAAFGYCPKSQNERLILTGVNWSVSVGGNPFRDLGYGQSLDTLLANQRAHTGYPIVMVVHMSCPKISYVDRGKSSISMPPQSGDEIIKLVEGVTAKWAKQIKAEERHESASLRREDVLMSSWDRKTSIKEAAYAAMAGAYANASDNNALPANARQIMYAARPAIFASTGKNDLNDAYFTQTLLVDYMNANPEETGNWEVVFSDRGHFTEPHTDREVGLGTLSVRRYLSSYTKPSLEEASFVGAAVKTHGPQGRFGALMYIEKEGFDPIVTRAEIAERHDCAIMSSKGMSVTAARQIVDATCARYDIPLIILHDFDISGFSIARTLHTSSRRYQYETANFRVIDIGMRLDDVTRLGLQSEPVALKMSKEAARKRLMINGATAEEIDFLTGGDGTGQRVELNAMTSRQFIDLIEMKLTEHGVRKIIPDAAGLDDAYRLMVRGERIREAVNVLLARRDDVPVDVPDDLEARVKGYLAEHPECPWDAAVEALITHA